MPDNESENNSTNLPIMRTPDIESLLQRFYDGQTSPEEEQTLRRLLAQKELPKHLQADKEFFQQLSATPAPDIPEGLEQRLSHLIDCMEKVQPSLSPDKSRSRFYRLLRIGSIAATVLLLLDLGLHCYIRTSYSRTPTGRPTPEDTCDTPEEAYAEAQKAFALFARTIDKGIESVVPLLPTDTKSSDNPN